MRNAATFLGIPDHLARRSTNIQHRWARNSIEPRQFETALRDLADELDSAPHLIDYQRRREALSCWCIEPDIWQLLRRLRPQNAHASRVELGDRKRQTASVMVWARVTQGEPVLAPHPICDRWPREVQMAWRRSIGFTWARYRALQARCDGLDLKGILDQYADTLAACIDRGEFP
jgi:hypothetical protein